MDWYLYIFYREEYEKAKTEEQTKQFEKICEERGVKIAWIVEAWR